MTTLQLSLAVLCAIACNVQAQFSPNFPGSTGPTFPRPPGPSPFPGYPSPPMFPGRPGWPSPIPQLPPTFPSPHQPPIFRFRRESPQEPPRSISIQGSQPMSGPDRHPSIDLNYNHRLIDNGRTKLDAFGGANLYRGRVTPNAGFGVEHQFSNDVFIRGEGQVQPGPHGGLTPIFGAGVGWRFRRDLPEESMDF